MIKQIEKQDNEKIISCPIKGKCYPIYDFSKCNGDYENCLKYSLQQRIN